MINPLVEKLYRIIKASSCDGSVDKVNTRGTENSNTGNSPNSGSGPSGSHNPNNPQGPNNPNNLYGTHSNRHHDEAQDPDFNAQNDANNDWYKDCYDDTNRSQFPGTRGIHNEVIEDGLEQQRLEWQRQSQVIADGLEQQRLEWQIQNQRVISEQQWLQMKTQIRKDPEQWRAWARRHNDRLMESIRAARR